MCNKDNDICKESDHRMIPEYEPEFNIGDVYIEPEYGFEHVYCGFDKHFEKPYIFYRKNCGAGGLVQVAEGELKFWRKVR